MVTNVVGCPECLFQILQITSICLPTKCINHPRNEPNTSATPPSMRDPRRLLATPRACASDKLAEALLPSNMSAATSSAAYSGAIDVEIDKVPFHPLEPIDNLVESTPVRATPHSVQDNIWRGRL